MEPASDQECRDLLVVGVHGTLEPDPAAHVLRDGEQFAGEAIPPFAEELLAPWLNRAAREADVLRMLPKNAIAGEPVPLNGLLETLKRRLSELISPALTEWSAGSDAAAFWRTFPALRWLVARTVRDWVQGTALFLERLAHDQALLAQSLKVPRLQAITSVEATTSDLHPRGAMVLRVRFAGDACVFYKPRPVTGEWLWWALLEAISVGRNLPAALVVFGGQSAGPAAYGWMESLRPDEAWPGRRSRPPVTQWSYWESAGVVLCYAQHLRLTDLHMGNVLATPNGPAIMDAECLGTVRAIDTPPDGFAQAKQGLRDTGLLPQRFGPTGVDASGLFGRAGAVPGLRISRWAHTQQGAWRLTSCPAALMRHENLPHDIDAISRRAVAAQLCSGYRRGAELLMQVRGQLLAEGSAWRKILETMHAPRCVLRETLLYGKLLSRSLMPSNATSQAERRTYLAASLAAEGTSVSKRVVGAEVSALMAGSIPRLAISPDSRALRDSNGRPLQTNFSACTPAEAVVRELESLTTARLEESLLPALLAALL